MYDKNSQIYQKEYFVNEEINEVNAKLEELKKYNKETEKLCNDLGIQE